MPLDFVIDLPCNPKRLLAGDDAPEEGVRRLLGLGKLEAIADEVRTRADGSGQNPSELRIRLVVARAGEETVPTPLTLAEIEAQTEVLRSFAPDCSKCLVSPNGRLVGCIGSVAHPISQSAEEWLLDRMAPPDTAGGFLVRSAIRDFHYDGAITKAWREKKLFASQAAFSAGDISTDQLFHAILGVGPTLSPWHMALVLVGFGALALDGAAPGSLEAFDALVNLPLEERRSRTSVTLGEPSADAGILGLQRLLMMMGLAWSRDVPVRLEG